MSEDEVDLEEKLSDVTCLIKFIIILDNSGKIILIVDIIQIKTLQKNKETSKNNYVSRLKI